MQPMIKNPQAMLAEFHEMFGEKFSTIPHIPPSNLIALRLKLIREEFTELNEALENRDLVEVADALGDLLYVVYGTALTCGIDIAPIVEEIHRSNMTKRGGKKRADGKWLKPDTWEPPRIYELLMGQIENREE